MTLLRREPREVYRVYGEHEFIASVAPPDAPPSVQVSQCMTQPASRGARRGVLLLGDLRGGGRRDVASLAGERGEAKRRLLEEQSDLTRASARSPGEPLRDYAALAGLAGFAREAYERLPPARQRAARIQIDRELDLRRELAASRSRRSSGGRRDSAGQAGMPPSAGGPPIPSAAREQADRGGGRAAASSVMRDAHAVAARRKRQLGRDRT